MFSKLYRRVRPGMLVKRPSYVPAGPIKDYSSLISQADATSLAASNRLGRLGRTANRHYVPMMAKGGKVKDFTSAWNRKVKEKPPKTFVEAIGPVLARSRNVNRQLAERLGKGVEQRQRSESPPTELLRGQARIQLETARSVLDDFGDFDKIPPELDELAAIEELGATLEEAGLAPELAEHFQILKKPQFLEVDSGNLGHAGAMYGFEVEGPEEIVRKLERYFETGLRSDD